MIMRKPPGIETGAAIRTIPVLSVSPIEEDHLFLEAILSNHCFWIPYADCKWKLHRGLSLESALTAVQENRMSIVICDGDLVCESDLLPGTWKEMLARIKPLPTPPLPVVTSRLADEYLWTEALNLGAYDVEAIAENHAHDELLQRRFPPGESRD
jgi:hypothetical protein